MSDSSPVITEADLAGLNQRALLRLVDVARRASIALLVLAGVIALAWVWQTLRYQGVITDGEAGGFTFFGGEDINWKQRVDAITLTMTTAAFAGLVGGLGLGLLVYCEVATARVGGSLTGWAVGDAIDDDRDAVELDPI